MLKGADFWTWKRVATLSHSPDIPNVTFTNPSGSCWINYSSLLTLDNVSWGNLNRYGQLGTTILVQDYPVMKTWKKKATLIFHFPWHPIALWTDLCAFNSPFSVCKGLQPLQSGEIDVTDLIGKKQKVVLLIQLQITLDASRSAPVGGLCHVQHKLYSCLEETSVVAAQKCSQPDGVWEGEGEREPISLQQPVLSHISFVVGLNSLLQLQNLPKGNKSGKRGVVWFTLPRQQV